MARILILAIYPAPYRVELIKQIAEKYDCDVFFENSGGDNRDEAWFTKGSYYVLDNENGKKKFFLAKKNIRKYSIVLIYDYSTKESLKLILKCKSLGVPYAINADGVMLTEHGNVMKETAKKIFISNARACFASGNKAKDYFIHYGANQRNIYLHAFSTLHRHDILTKPVSEKEKLELRYNLQLPEQGRIVIAVGRFIPLKRYKELIECWKMMPDNVILLLIGGGELESEYKNTVEATQLNNVIIEPFHPMEELMQFYRAADVFVHPTSYDVWGLVVNEAMASGLPCVVSDHCVAGLELIKDGVNGYLTEMGREDIICQRVLQIFNDKKLHDEMAINALETIKGYTIENMAEMQIRAIDLMVQE